MEEKKGNLTRRNFLESGMRGACVLALGGLGGFTLSKTLRSETVWQFDPATAEIRIFVAKTAVSIEK